MNEPSGQIVQTQISDILRQLKLQEEAIEQINTNPLLINQQSPSVQPTSAPQAVNYLRNGSFSYNIPAWFNDGSGGDLLYSCVWWYSHPNVPNQPLFLITAAGGGVIRTFPSTAVNTGTDTVTLTANGFVTGQSVLITAGGSPPSPLVGGNVYFIIVITANTFKFATTYANAVAGTAINLTTQGSGTNTLSFDYTLKSPLHSLYNPSASVWIETGAEAGTASINQGWTLDAPIAGPDPVGQPSYTCYGVINLAKSSIYVTAPTGARLGGGLYAQQNGTWDYLNAPYTITDTVRAPVISPTSRDYLVHTKTNRGFTVNTSTLTVASAPSDTDFGNGAGVVLNWQKALNYGVTNYFVYRKTGSTYVLLTNITNGTTSYIDNNTQMPDVVTSFPTADFTGLFTYSNTIPGVLTNLATAGVSPQWDSIPFALLVPSGYNVGLTDLSLKQWMRWNITGLNNNNWDITVTDVYVDDDGITLHSAAAQFTSSMVGLTITLANGTTTYTGTVATYSSAPQITVTPAVNAIFVAIIVQAAGTTSINGTYTFRGTFSGKPYYNLVGLPDDPTTQSIAWNLSGTSEWEITDVVSVSAYVSSDAVSFPYDVTTWVIGDPTSGLAPVPIVSQYQVSQTIIQGAAPLSSVFFDLAQLSYGANAIFTFNPQDLDGTHGIPPVTPNGSTQGGTGIIFPAPGDGGPTCVWGNEIVQVIRGLSRESDKAIHIKRGDVLIDRHGRLNHVEMVKYDIADVYMLTTANGFVSHTSNTHKYHTPGLADSGLVLAGLKVGDEIITSKDGADEITTIANIERIGKDTVVEFGLAPGHGYLIGTGDYQVWGGISSNNIKTFIGFTPL